MAASKQLPACGKSGIQQRCRQPVRLSWLPLKAGCANFRRPEHEDVLDCFCQGAALHWRYDSALHPHAVMLMSASHWLPLV